MERDFDFDRVGKRMPYRTPDGFLDEMEANIWKEVQGGLPSRHQRPTYRLRVLAGVSAVAAGLLLLLAFHTFSSEDAADAFSSVEQAFAGLSQEDQAYMLSVYQEDIFMNE